MPPSPPFFLNFPLFCKGVNYKNNITLVELMPQTWSYYL